MSMTSLSGLANCAPIGGGQAESHRAHAARREPQARTAEIEVLRRPHLMLADAGADDGLALGQSIDFFDDVIRLNQLAVAIVVHRVRRDELRAVLRATRTSRA